MDQHKFQSHEFIIIFLFFYMDTCFSFHGSCSLMKTRKPELETLGSLNFKSCKNAKQSFNELPHHSTEVLSQVYQILVTT